MVSPKGSASPMFIVTAKAPKRRHLLSAALIVLLIVAVPLLLRMRKTDTDSADELRAETNEARVKYLESLGWDVDTQPVESLRLTLPEELVEPYRSYNGLQLTQGFDLTPFLGETLERHTYAVRNYPNRPNGCQADLYLSEGFIVAGDIVCAGADGFIAPLEFPESK